MFTEWWLPLGEYTIACEGIISVKGGGKRRGENKEKLQTSMEDKRGKG